MATLAFFDDELYRRIVSVFGPDLVRSCKPQELSNTLWAFANLGFGSLPSSTFSEIAASMNDYVVLKSTDPEGDEELVRQATDAITECALPQISRFKSQELNNLAWALARLGRKDARTILEAISMQLCHPKRRVSSQVRK